MRIHENGDSQHKTKKSKKQNIFQGEVLSLQMQHLKESKDYQQQFLEPLFEAHR